MLVDDGCGDRDDLVVLAKGKSTHHEVFLSRTAELLHPGGTPDGPRLIANVTEGVSSPPPQGDGERTDRGHMIAPSRLEVRLVQLLLEESGIDLTRTRNERISRCFGSDSVGPELITQQRDVGRQGGPHTFRGARPQTSSTSRSKETIRLGTRSRRRIRARRRSPAIRSGFEASSRTSSGPRTEKYTACQVRSGLERGLGKRGRHLGIPPPVAGAFSGSVSRLAVWDPSRSWLTLRQHRAQARTSGPSLVYDFPPLRMLDGVPSASWCTLSSPAMIVSKPYLRVIVPCRRSEP